MEKTDIRICLCGAAAGAVTGLFGAGGGMVLVPLLSRFTDLEEDQIFPASVSIILPVCIVSIVTNALGATLPLREALPYLLGSLLGGVAAAFFTKKIPVKWLHRVLGVLVLWGGIRYLC